MDRFDPGAVRRVEHSARGRYLDMIPDRDGGGLCDLEGKLFVHDGEALNRRLGEMARGVCADDPRTVISAAPMRWRRWVAGRTV